VSAYDVRGEPNQGTDSELPTDPQTPRLSQAKGPAMHSGLLLPSPDKSPLQKEVHRICRSTQEAETCCYSRFCVVEDKGWEGQDLMQEESGRKGSHCRQPVSDSLPHGTGTDQNLSLLIRAE
jgi:hypothetical protein